jgi:hypothetical protein
MFPVGNVGLKPKVESVELLIRALERFSRRAMDEVPGRHDAPQPRRKYFSALGVCFHPRNRGAAAI